MRTIIHLDLDTFFVSCERLLNPSLNGKPVIIGGTTGRGIVSTCSYEARKFGIHGNMPMRLAKQLCPEAVIIRGNSGIYGEFSRAITEIIKESAPLYEKASFDEFYIDMTGMEKYVGTIKWADELRKRIIKKLKLPLSMSIAVNKVVSKVGTEQAKPNGFITINAGAEKEFLKPLSVKSIPGVGPETFYKLREMGAQYVQTVQEMPKELLYSSFGENGITIWNRCQGLDTTPVVQYYERKSIGIERTFEKDTIDVAKIRSLVIAMAENLAMQLRNGNKLTSIVIVRIRYADLSVFSKQKRIPFTSNDHTLIEVAKGLFEKLYERRLLIRLIGVRYAGLVHGGHQISLLDDTGERCNLYQAMDHIRKRFGQDAVKRATALGSNHIGSMNPFNGEPPWIPAHRRA